MRKFNEREKIIINKILESSKHVSMRELLQEFYFTEQNGRALITQSQGRYSVFFLKKEIFDDETKKKEEVELFFELISLINYLSKYGYLTIYREKTEKLYFFQDAFVNPQPSDNSIILNAKGDFTSIPDTIQDKNKNVIYKGIVFDADIFALILNTTTGIMIVSQNLKDLLIDNEASKKLVGSNNKSENPYKTPATLNTTKLGLFIWITSLLVLSALTFYFRNKATKYDDQLMQIMDNHASIQKNIQAVLVNVKNTNQVKVNNTNNIEDSLRYFYGVDISKWNGDEVKEIDPTDSISFIICKATEGITGVDPEFKQNWKTIKDKQYILGAYHFYLTNDDPLKQAEHFWTTISAQGKTDIAPIVDIEQQSLPLNGKVDIANLQNNLLLFLNYIEKKCNRIPMIYTGEAFANQYILNETLSKYPLWLAEYTKASKPKVPSIWKEKGYKIWQKRDNYFIDTHPTDFDVFYGKKSDLYK